MIDDEKRKAQAALLGMTLKGQTLGDARSGANPGASADIKFWACSSSGCDALNPANRNKCGEYSGTRFAIVAESFAAKCNTSRSRDVPSDKERDVIVIDD